MSLKSIMPIITGAGAIARPVDPDHVWTFDNGGALGADSIGTDDLTLSGSYGGVSGVDGLALALADSSENAVLTPSSLGSAYSLCGYFKLQTTNNNEILRIVDAVDSGIWLQLIAEQFDADQFDLKLKYDDGTTETSQTIARLDKNTWYFWGVAVNDGTDIAAFLAGSSFGPWTADIPSFTGGINLSLNANSDASADSLRDEMSAWDSVALSPANFRWIEAGAHFWTW